LDSLFGRIYYNAQRGQIFVLSGTKWHFTRPRVQGEELRQFIVDKPQRHAVVYFPREQRCFYSNWQCTSAIPFIQLGVEIQRIRKPVESDRK